MLDSHVTICLVTHSASSAQDVCTRGIVLDNGAIVFDGDIDQAIERYESNAEPYDSV